MKMTIRNSPDEKHYQDTLFAHHSSATKKGYMRHSIELVVFLEAITINIFLMMIPNTVESHYCRSILNASGQECLNNSLEYNEEAQEIVAHVNVMRTYFENLIPTVLLIVAGPWSDIHGRKSLLLASTSGGTMTFILWAVSTRFPFLNPSDSALLSIPMMLGGGPFSEFATQCYVCDISSAHDRSFRLVMLEVSFYTGLIIGSLMCSYVIQQNYAFGFFIAAIFSGTALLYVVFFLEESLAPYERSLLSKKDVLFKLSDVKEIVTTCYTTQTYRMRIILLMLFLVVILLMNFTSGTENIEYLFLQRTQDWNLHDFSTLVTVSLLFHCIMAYGGNWWLNEKLKFDDLHILVIIMFFYVLSMLIYANSFEIWHIYFSNFLRSGHALFHPVMKSFLSRIVPREEIGKILTSITVMEEVSVFSGIAIFNTLYRMTLSTNPFLSYYVAAFMATITICLLLFANKLFNEENHDASMLLN